MGGTVSARAIESSRLAKKNRKLLSEGRLNKRVLARLLDENEPITLSLDEEAFIFHDGMWLPDFRARDYRKLSKQNQFIAAENGLLKVKVDVLLELISDRATEKSKRLLTQRRNSVMKNVRQGFDTQTSSSNIELAMSDKASDKVSTSGGDLEGVLFAIGDPLLDIVADVPISVLQKYHLDADSGVLMGEQHATLVEEMLSGSYKVAYVPGGSEQNCLKVIQRLIGVPNATTYLGCIGRDKNGEVLVSAMRECGINARYQYVEGKATGVCYICLTGSKRSLVTKLSAAESPVLDLLKKPENWAFVEKARYFYVEAYSVANRYEEMLLIARHSLQHNKVFAMNLSCPYLSSRFKDELTSVLPYVDILFGSELEALAFGAAHELNTNEIGEIALSLARTPKANGRRGRVVILTRGKNPVVAVCDGQVRTYPVIPTAAEDIRDTVGAGDSFAGGYLAALVIGRRHEECMQAALEAAHYVIRLRVCELVPEIDEGTGLNRSQDEGATRERENKK